MLGEAHVRHTYRSKNMDKEQEVRNKEREEYGVWVNLSTMVAAPGVYLSQEELLLHG